MTTSVRDSDGALRRFINATRETASYFHPKQHPEAFDVDELKGILNDLPGFLDKVANLGDEESLKGTSLPKVFEDAKKEIGGMLYEIMRYGDSTDIKEKLSEPASKLKKRVDHVIGFHDALQKQPF